MQTPQHESIPLADLQSVALSLTKPDGTKPIEYVMVDTKREYTRTGCFDFVTKEIIVALHPNRAVMVFTLFHEIGHAMIHGRAQLNRYSVLDAIMFQGEYARMEVEADLVATLVFEILGWQIPREGFSILARATPELLADAALRAMPVAERLVDAIRAQAAVAQ